MGTTKYSEPTSFEDMANAIEEKQPKTQELKKDRWSLKGFLLFLASWWRK